jgi:hypothetical protein
MPAARRGSLTFSIDAHTGLFAEANISASDLKAIFAGSGAHH